MSDLTLALLGKTRPQRATRWRSKMEKITRLLVSKYGTPSLGNLRDPVEELFYIALSAKTSERNYKAAYMQLRRRFRDLVALSKGSLPEIYMCIGMAGLGKKRAKYIKEIASRLLQDFGARPTNGLRKLSADNAYTYLRTLPGIGPKSALCVMMYSLGFDVFPADAHANRVLGRIGVITSGAKHYEAQSVLPAFVPNGCSKRLHVALIIHGRRVCKARLPRCKECSILQLCATGRTNIRGQR